MSTHDPRGGHEDETTDWPGTGAAEPTLHYGDVDKTQVGYPVPPPAPPQGPPPHGYGWAMPPPQPGKNNAKWWIVGMSVALAVALVVIGVLVFSDANDGGEGGVVATAPAPLSEETPSVTTDPAAPSSPSTGSDAASVAAADLERYLLSTDEIAEKLKSPPLQGGPVVDEPATGGVFSPADCAGAYGPVDAATYDGSGFTGIAAQSVREQPKAYHQVLQGLVAFRDEAAAKAFFDEQMKSWRDCGSKRVTAVFDGEPHTATTATPSIVDGTAMLQVTPEALPDKPARMCQRAMSTRLNVVVDMRVCVVGYVGSQALSLVRDINTALTGKP